MTCCHSPQPNGWADDDANRQHKEKNFSIRTSREKCEKSRFIKRDIWLVLSWEKGNDRVNRERKAGERVMGEESLARLITSGSKFPVNRFYNTQAILLKEEAIRLRPTFHLRLTFMSSTQFYHSKFNVYLSADAIQPCYHLNHAGLIIISPRANTLPTKRKKLTSWSRKFFSLFSAIPAVACRTCVLYNKWLHFLS